MGECMNIERGPAELKALSEHMGGRRKGEMQIPLKGCSGILPLQSLSIFFPPSICPFSLKMEVNV
jgi:hypothetical protein